MYIGGVGTAGLHHLVWEIFDNSVDEAMNGHATEIIVTLHKDGERHRRGQRPRHPGRHPPEAQEARARDHPLDAPRRRQVRATTTTRPSGGLHGVGASVVNALSAKLVATVKRDGAEWQMEFKQGELQGKLKKLGAARGTGTTCSFEPDPTIFPRTEFNAETIRERLEVASYLHRG